MKIVHVCLCGPMTDGWNYQENLLTKYHKKNGHDVTIVASQWIWGENGKKLKYEKTDYDNEDGVHVIRIPLLIGSVDSRLKVYKGLVRILEKEEPDILFIHDVQFLDMLSIRRFLVKMKRKRQVKVYADNHVDFSNGARNWISKQLLHKILWRWVVNAIEPWVTKFYGVLPARVDFLKSMYGLPEEKCELLVMGGDDEAVERAAAPKSIQTIRNQLNVSREDFVVMTGGKIDAYKTQTLLLMEAVTRINDPRLKLVVFGSVSDELKDKVDSYAKNSAINYIGWINARDSYQYFAAADLVVFPGRHSVFWEQVAAQGIPMVCKQWEGTQHVDIGGNVLFLKNDSVQEIESVLRDLLYEDGKYQEMKEKAEGDGKRVFSYSDISLRSIM